MIETRRISRKLATVKDLPHLERMLDHAKQQICSEGITQWTETYPNHEDIYRDILKRQLWLFGDDVKAMAVIEENLNFWNIKRLVVDSAFSGKGIASLVIDEIKQLMVVHHVAEARLCTNHTNHRMIRLANHQGFLLHHYYHAQDRENFGAFIEFRYRRFSNADSC